MIENIEKTVLMKCEVCGYQEEVPIATLERLRDLPPVSDEYKILCPFCLNDMYKKESDHFKKK